LLRHEKKKKEKIPQNMNYVHATKALQLTPVSGMTAPYFENPKAA
jgi:hypothetical protein